MAIPDDGPLRWPPNFVVDETLPRGEVQLRGPRGEVLARITNIGPRVFVAPDGTLVVDQEVSP